MPPHINRTGFRLALRELEDGVLAVGHRAEALLRPAVRAMRRGDAQGAAAVVSHDHEIHVCAFDLEERIHRTITLQAPVAHDLRLLLGLLNVLRSVERVADYGVNVAKLATDAETDGDHPDLADQLHEMAVVAEQAMRAALTAFGHRDVDGPTRIAAIEDRLDLLHAGLTDRLIDHAESGGATSYWAMRAIQAARDLERVGDHAVSVAQQGAWVASGQRRLPRAAH